MSTSLEFPGKPLSLKVVVVLTVQREQAALLLHILTAWPDLTLTGQVEAEGRRESPDMMEGKAGTSSGLPVFGSRIVFCDPFWGLVQNSPL